MVIKEKLEISKELQRKINNLGKFNGQKLKLVEGSIITVPKTNIAYIEPHKLEIGSDTYLILGKNEIMYISKNNITNKISLQELEEVIRNAKNQKDKNVQKWTKKDNFVLEKDIWAVDNGIIENFYQSKKKEEWL